MRAGRAIVGVITGLAAAQPALAAERLVTEPYPGGTWHEVANQSNGGAFIRVQMPEGQTPESAQDVLTAQAIPGYRGQPADFITRAFTQLGQNCDAVETVGPTTVEEQGRQVAYGRLYCGRQKGHPYGAHVFFKAILGSEALYVVDRDFRTPGSDKPGAPPLPDDQAIAFLQAEGTATRYLTNKVYVCDPVFPDPKCASDAAPTGPR